jgi:hypothetical protein
MVSKKLRANNAVPPDGGDEGITTALVSLGDLETCVGFGLHPFFVFCRKPDSSLNLYLCCPDPIQTMLRRVHREHEGFTSSHY